MAIVTVTDWSVTPVTHNRWRGENLQELTNNDEYGEHVVERTAQLYVIDGHYAGSHKLYGSGLTYDAAGKFSGGVVTGWDFVWIYGDYEDGVSDTRFSITGVSVPATSLRDLSGGAFDAAQIVFAGDDSMTGGSGGDTLWGYGGGDLIVGGTGADAINGDLGNDTTNGNQGNDTVRGGQGDDWVVGGKDQDVLFGDEGADILYGNLGNDTCSGGAGNDVVRGGQGDDSLSGGGDDDWLSGDLGSDTLSGGAGADVFHSFGEAGVDRVTDFNRGEGDRVQLDPGAAYTVAQLGADTVITLGGGAQVILVGVQLSALTGDWIVIN